MLPAIRALYGIFFFLLVLAVYPYIPEPATHVKDLLLAVFAAAVTGLYAVAVYLGLASFRRPRIFLEMIALLHAFLLLGVLRSEFRWLSFYEWQTFISLSCLYLVATQAFFMSKHIRTFFIAAVSAATIAAVYALLQRAGLDPFPWGERESDVYTHLPSTFGNPNFAAHAYMFLLPAAVYLALTHHRAWWGSVALILLHFWFTGQRAGRLGLVAALVAVGFTLWFGRKSTSPIRTTIKTMVTTALLGVVGFAGAMGLTYLRTGTAFPLDVSLLIRYQSLVSASNMLLSRPILGYGPGVYRVGYVPFWTPFEQQWFAQEGRINLHVHNDFLELGLDGGLPAALLYVCILVLAVGFSLLYANRATEKPERLLGLVWASAFMGTAVDGLFGFPLRVPVSASLFFIFLGFVDAAWLSATGQTQRPSSQSRGVIPLVALMAILSLTAVCVQTASFVSEQCRYRGRLAENNGRFEEAERWYRQGASLAPWQSRFLRNLALLAIRREDTQEGITLLSGALRREPYHIPNLTLMATVHRESAQRYFAQNPKDLRSALLRLDQAAGYAQKALTLCPMYAPALQTLGEIHYTSAVFTRKHASPEIQNASKEHLRQAENYFQKAIENGVGFPEELYRRIGSIRVQLGDTEGATAAYVRSIQINPKYTETWREFLQHASNTGQYEILRNTLYESIRRVQENPEEDKQSLSVLHVWLAAVLTQGYQDLDGAEAAYLAAARLAPNSPELWSFFAEFARQHNRRPVFEQAIRDAVQQLRTENKQPIPALAIAHSLLTGGDKTLEASSMALLEVLRTSDRSDSNLKTQDACRWVAALLLEAVNSALASREVSCTTLLNMGIIENELDDLAVSDLLFSRAQECISPEQQGYLAVHWADTLLRTERGAKALEILEKALQRDPNNFEVRLALARAYTRMERTEEARRLYEALLQEPDLNDRGRQMVEEELKRLP